MRGPDTAPKGSGDPLDAGVRQDSNDVIAAQATRPGTAALAVVRISGAGAHRLGVQLAGGRAPPPSHQMARRTLRDAAGCVLDDAMVVHFHAPRSYTGEDVVELFLHGGQAIVDAVLACCWALGARPARGGEFTERAFLAGRLDLAQAEAVAELIGAAGEAQRQAALVQLAGGLSRRIEALIDRLCAWVTPRRALLDFPDDAAGIGPASTGLADVSVCLADTADPTHADGLAEGLGGVLAEVRGMRLQTRPRAASGPPKVVLSGPPNAGKSTLLNAWLHEERVLVDAQAGTTRDAVAAEVCRGGCLFTATDTAGIRDAALASDLERRGMALARQHAQGADLCVWLSPVASAAQPDAWPPVGWPRGCVVVGSKDDLADEEARAVHRQQAQARDLAHWGWLSARDPLAIEALAERVGRAATSIGGDRAQDTTRAGHRHAEALAAAERALGEAAGVVSDPGRQDVLVHALDVAVARLGEILGRQVTREVTHQVFADFCIGK